MLTREFAPLTRRSWLSTGWWIGETEARTEMNDGVGDTDGRGRRGAVDWPRAGCAIEVGGGSEDHGLARCGLANWGCGSNDESREKVDACVAIGCAGPGLGRVAWLELELSKEGKPRDEEAMNLRVVAHALESSASRLR